MYWSTLDSVWFRRGQWIPFEQPKKFGLWSFEFHTQLPHPGPAFHWHQGHDANRIRSGRMWSKKTSSHSWHTSFTSLKVDIFRLKHLCRLVAKKKNVWCYIASWKWYLSLDVTGISLIAFDPLDLWDGQVRLVRLRQLADGREWREIMLISLLLQVSSPSI